MSDCKRKFLESETEFGLSLLRQLPLDDCLVFSPLSISLALSLVHSGANGQTKQQITQAICNGASDDEVISHYRAVSTALLASSIKVEDVLTNSKQDRSNSRRGKVMVNIANKMFIRDDVSIKQSYLDKIARTFDASAENLDFSDCQKAAEIVNKFISDETGGKIKDMLKPDSFRTSVALLVNALYFNAKWSDQFEPEQIENLPFFSNKSTQRKIPFLKDTRQARSYGESHEVQVLSLEYRDQSYAFTIFLPKERFGLEKFCQDLTASKLQGLLKNVDRRTVWVYFPKMNIEKELDLVEILKTIGITDMFSDNADLGGIANGLSVSKVTHKAMIEVNETGTIAAAATVVELDRERARKPTKFLADHPFLFTITHDNHVLFMGKHV